MKKTVIREYTLSHIDKKMSGEICIAFLTDIHNCLSTKEQEYIFSLLKKVNPDLVLVGGDMLIGKKNTSVELAADFIKILSENYKVIYANGNHEQRVCIYPEVYGDMGKRYEEMLAGTKAIRAVNQAIDMDINGVFLTIYGFEPEAHFYARGSKPKGMLAELHRVFPEKENGRYRILLAHTPRFAKEYLDWGANLVLSGHYHGGMMLLGKRLGVISPDYRLLNRDCCGIRTQGNSHMIVSAGLGEHTIPFRIHNPRELTVVRVKFLQG